MESSNQLHAAYQAAKSGDRLRARQILKELFKSEPGNERAWFLYAKVSESREQSIQCLEKVLEINPFNPIAIRDLELLRRRQAVSSGGSPSQPSPIQKSQSPLASARGGLPAWIWLLGAGLVGLLIIVCIAIISIYNPPLLDTQAADPVAVSPVVLPTPTSDCDCARATAYLDNTFVRFDIITSQIESIESAMDTSGLSQVDFFTFSAEAKTLYKDQLGEAPPPCMQAFQTKTVSLLWNWQQSMQYAASGQYDAVDVFLQGFVDEFSALENEGLKLEEKLRGCIQDPSTGPSL